MKKSGGKLRLYSLLTINSKIGARSVSRSPCLRKEDIKTGENKPIGMSGAVGGTSGAGYCFRRGSITVCLKLRYTCSASSLGNGSWICVGSVRSGISRMERR